ncbi:MAG: CDP-glycerol glycerophosphotransferase family protein [Firmicutes bacterium]|nr:CDP-glycerol glycerophosphotransferase family protein [Bacillota bacterium]
MEKQERIKIKDRRGEDLLRAVITDIRWERVILHLEMRLSGPLASTDPVGLALVLVSERGYANGKFRLEESRCGQEGVLLKLSMNITNPGFGMCLANGQYRLAILHGEDLVCVPQVELKVAGLLSEKSHIFLRGMLHVGYSVVFSLAEGEDLEMVIICQNMERKDSDPLYEKDLPIFGVRQNPPNLIVRWIRRQHRPTIRSMYAFHRAFRKKDAVKKRVLFLSEQSEKLGGNLTAVIERMKERGLDDAFTITTSARNIKGIGHYGIRSWNALMKKAADADYIFVDDHVPFMDWLILAPETQIVQLWHAGAGYKSSGYSRWGHLDAPAPFCGHRQYDYGITASRSIAHFFSEVFGINTERILPTGMPRMDRYLDPGNRERVTKEFYEKNPGLREKKIILFAPTFRGMDRKQAYYPFDLIDQEALYEACGDEYVVLFKMHPWVKDKVPLAEHLKDRLYDFSSYPDINDLYYVADLLITDYSSSVFEFSLMRKPMLFFAFDELEYAYTRGFHREYRPACPGKICNTFAELVQAIRDKDFEFEKNAPYLAYHFDHIDTGARDRVIDWFLLGEMPAEIKAPAEARERENEWLKRLDFSEWQ